MPEHPVPEIEPCSSLPAYGYAHHAYTIARRVPTTVRPTATRSRSATLSRLTRRLDLAAAAHAINGGMPDLPDRVRLCRAKPNKQLGGVARQAGRIRRDLRTDRLLQSARGRVLAVPAAPTIRLRGPAGVKAVRRLPDRLEYVERVAQAIVSPASRCRSWSPSSSRDFSLWGLVRPADGATNVTVLVSPRARVITRC